MDEIEDNLLPPRLQPITQIETSEGSERRVLGDEAELKGHAF